MEWSIVKKGLETHTNRSHFDQKSKKIQKNDRKKKKIIRRRVDEKKKYNASCDCFLFHGSIKIEVLVARFIFFFLFSSI